MYVNRNSINNLTESEKKQYKGYLLDLDGTIYRGKQAIPEAIDFVKRLQVANIPYLFLTNNSSQTKQQVVDKISGFGLKVDIAQVYTSSMAAARFLADSHKRQGLSALVIGEAGLYEALADFGIELVDSYDVHKPPTHVIMGIDRAISYQKLAAACLAVRSGAQLLATNLDKAVPTERGLLPGNGALVAAVVESTGVKPIATGKPSTIIAKYALQHLNNNSIETSKLAADDIVMVGDNFDTDIMTAKCFGMDSILVYTGLMTDKELPDKIAKNDYQPTWVLNTLADWLL